MNFNKGVKKLNLFIIILIEQLWQADCAYAAEIQAAGCSCGGNLNNCDYLRKPKGLDCDDERYNPEWDKRLCFCCGRCRRYVIPASLRFLGRRHYWGWLILIKCVVGQDKAALKDCLEELRANDVSIDERTVQRWLDWWQEEFVHSECFKTLRGLMNPKWSDSPIVVKLFLKAREKARKVQSTCLFHSLLVELLLDLRPLTGHLSRKDEIP